MVSPFNIERFTWNFNEKARRAAEISAARLFHMIIVYADKMASAMA